MDFGWSPMQRELHQGVLKFARSLDVPASAGTDVDVQRGLFRECGKAGLLGLSVPEAHGGLGLDAQTTARTMEAFGEGCGDMGLVFACAAHLNACAMPILEAGSEDIVRRYLPGLTSGALVGANAISEAGAGSDLSAMRMRATRDGQQYVLEGEKSWVTNAPLADVFTVYAVTNPGDGYMGISAFVVERDSPGISVGKPFDKMGLKTAMTAPVHFEGCRVHADNMLGAEGRGLAVFNNSMSWERSCLFAGYLGLLERQLVQTVEHAKNRRQFRKPIASQQAVSHRIVDMRVRLDAARLLLQRACWLMDQDEAAVEAIAMAKLAISEAAVQSSLDAIRTHGGMGVVMESGVPQGLLDSVPCTVFSGTSDMQRNLIAREMGL